MKRKIRFTRLLPHEKIEPRFGRLELVRAPVPIAVDILRIILMRFVIGQDTIGVRVSRYRAR